MNKKLLNYYFNLVYKKSNFHVFNILLLVLSGIYFFCILTRRLFYKFKIFKTTKFAGTYIISVGNITTGGTGKTPVVMKLVEILLAQNKKVAVISRGYKRKSKAVKIVLPHSQNLDIDELGDEPFMIANRYSDVYVGVGQDRIAVLNQLLPEKMDVCILDDGYQKLSIARDLNILLIDSTNPFGNGFLLPRGILRESVKNIKRADLIILTKTNLLAKTELDLLTQKIKNTGYENRLILAKYLPVYFYNFFTKQKVALDELRGKSVDILTGIGNPKSLEQTLENLGVKVGKNYIFPDHHWFDETDFAGLTDDVIITTEKDAVKLLKFQEIFQDKQIFSLVMDVEFPADFEF